MAGNPFARELGKQCVYLFHRICSAEQTVKVALALPSLELELIITSQAKLCYICRFYGLVGLLRASLDYTVDFWTIL